jgi:tetratricopeptide (TPR) repeat protein
MLLALVALSTAAIAKTVPPPPPPPSSEKVPVPELLKEESANYDLCLTTARTYPEQGFELAGRWEGIGGGQAAQHCAAVALIGLHQYAEAATRLETLATSTKRGDDVRAGLFAQAGQAWFLDDKNDRAFADQSTALKIAAPHSAQAAALFVDRAQTLADSGKYDDAVSDLTDALAIEPMNVDALTFRASAYRNLDKIDPALHDAEKAVALDPKNPDARLMRGNLYAAVNRPNDARQDWLVVLESAPDSDAATSARANLERMDVKGEDQPAAHK